MKIKRALISVNDKAGIEDFARGLVDQGVTVIASGGTGRLLARSGIPVTTVADVTGAPEMLDGRVKTLHPSIHGGILADRRKPQHLAQLKQQGIAPIDLVVCNLYPFASTVADPQVSEDDALEQIDIGGTAMVRAAAKNHKSVAVVVNPSRYEEILEEMTARSGALSDATRADLASEAFEHTAAFDISISRWMSRSTEFPQKMLLSLERSYEMRYGENPHQAGAFYLPATPDGRPPWHQLAGKELSYTNFLDFSAAWQVASEFHEPAFVVVKHTNPCGVATADDIAEAYEKAVDCDERSAFGGIFAANREIDGPVAKRMMERIPVSDIVVAPSITHDALAAFSDRKVLRVIQASKWVEALEVRSAAGGVLVQSPDDSSEGPDAMTVATNTQPTDEDWADLLFAWKVCKHVKSNSVVLAKAGQALGIGAGQMSRVEAVELAARRAGDRAKGTVCATDGSFPFRDGIDVAVEAGARAIIHPGGSVRDPEIIAAAEEHGIPMVLTGTRHFRH